MTQKAPIYKELLALLAASPSMRVLDLGCGRGECLGALVETVGADGHVTGLDSNDGFLDAASETCEKAGIGDRVNLIAHDIDAQPLPFSDGEFDRILCHNVLECLEDKLAAVNECHRTLKLGGSLLLSHHDFDTAQFNSSYRDLTRRLVHIYADTTQGWQAKSDGQMGRKLAGIAARALFTSFEAKTLLFEEHNYEPGTYGHCFSQDVVEIATKTGQFDANDLEAWQQNLAALHGANDYYFSICVMTVMATR